MAPVPLHAICAVWTSQCTLDYNLNELCKLCTIAVDLWLLASVVQANMSIEAETLSSWCPVKQLGLQICSSCEANHGNPTLHPIRHACVLHHSSVVVVHPILHALLGACTTWDMHLVCWQPDSRPDHQQRQSSTWLQMLGESIYMVTNSGLDSQTLLERHNETHGYHLQVLHENRWIR